MASIFLIAASLSACKGQVINCDSVRTGLEPALEPCRSSVTECVNSPSFDLVRVGALLCEPVQEGQFNNFRTCTNRSFTDQIYATICSGANCSTAQQQSSFFDCEIPDRERCYNVPEINNGDAAFTACMCASEDQTFSTCSAECRAELEQLVEDIGCCAHAAIYTFFFSTCGNADDVDTPLDTINALFDVCDVTLPPTCLHPFTMIPGGGSLAITAELLGLFISLFAFMLI